MDIFDSIYIKVCFTVQTSNFDWIVLKKKDLRSSYTVTHFGIQGTGAGLSSGKLSYAEKINEW